MRVCGLVVEYNPFHYGHLHHLLEAKRITKADLIIIIMSPTFMQRGEPAITNKFTRTQVALDYGVDLVVELPSIMAINSSDYF
ncbi:MAG: nucleotidyltransferase family protein, partial [Bacilli bacterium]